ncbi:hypothetical protein [Pseudobacteriovorax antillogorgiicola]|uniref:Uncharacterized protein n=1 Tax=Pseudobacteriovorax antillogorgiicola TaxID=1513793 RepID=A0A1Y6CS72_9BACT|nr:hypothetical protein [Pseudobacteriovorax antillogorgiicola]TCS40907.1 hypothetical protein EDD56_1526 [Pseudobacteriovorax antillogorgiicola]SMF84107.1 hypothetical protein SAMN06296036_1528 [Pseudobacteriovorax antillogorgiicola]
MYLLKGTLLLTLGTSMFSTSGFAGRWSQWANSYTGPTQSAFCPVGSYMEGFEAIEHGGAGYVNIRLICSNSNFSNWTHPQYPSGHFHSMNVRDTVFGLELMEHGNNGFVNAKLLYGNFQWTSWQNTYREPDFLYEVECPSRTEGIVGIDTIEHGNAGIVNIRLYCK